MDETDKEKLKAALGLEIHNNDLSPKSFETALQKYVKLMADGRGIENTPSSEIVNSQRPSR